MKTCANPDCDQVNPQPLSNFSNSKRNKDKLKVRCKSCRNSQAREWYKKLKKNNLRSTVR